MKFETSYHNPSARPWTRRDEVRQRIGNCWRMLIFAWLALRYNSALFSGVFLNVARQEGDLMISKIVMHGGREIVVPTDNK